MTKILMCTGKKSKVAAMLKYFTDLDKKGHIKLLGKRLQTKRALIWSYDELKLLYDLKHDRQDPLPDGLTRALDYFAIKDQAMVVVKFATKQVEDSLLKPKILALSRPFLSKNVTVKLAEEEFRHNDYKIERKCTGQISGPVSSVMTYRELLEKEDLCDPKTVSYIF